ncbi:hypothetical protein KDW07_26820 [Burkholderia dolosa]|uniref:hypothetical protein n=1 Tax=Burkholderia dolosa TaxID=152500 RepID=UPI001B9F4072|nr:hypothetical protein [Burkholderia dolosa]MBR8460757.1 hypothetical protein [Burkholderia dolosa]
MKLTIQQRGYMTERLSAIAKRRIDKDTTAKLGPKPEIPKLTFKDKYELIRTGKAKLKPYSEISSYTDLVDAYSYPVDKVDVARRALAAWEAKAEKIAAAINAEKQRIVDQLMLGDATAALAALDKFEKAAA